MDAAKHASQIGHTSRPSSNRANSMHLLTVITSSRACELIGQGDAGDRGQALR